MDGLLWNSGKFEYSQCVKKDLTPIPENDLNTPRIPKDR
jgi:hypothetical protein